MGRVHFWQFLRDEDGSAIPNADISIYLAGSTTPANIYENEVGGSSIGNAPHMRTNSEGFFEFWIGDDDEVDGYNSSQKFKIAWDKIGIVAGYIDFINVFPPIIPVNETSTSEVKDKCVSNLLAKIWTDHASDTTHIVHGIAEVNENDTNTVKNKLVSNAQAKAWSTANNTFNFYTGSTPTSADAHGIAKVNPVSTDVLRNKLVSNNDIKVLNDHVGWSLKNTFESWATNPHGLDLGDETSDDTTPNKLVSNALLKRIKGTNASTFSDSVNANEWTLSNGVYEYICTHNLGQNYPQVTLWRTDTGIVVIPISIENINTNSIKIKILEQFAAFIRCSI